MYTSILFSVGVVKPKNQGAPSIFIKPDEFRTNPERMAPFAGERQAALMATREIFWNIPFAGEILLYILAVVSVAFFGYGIYVHVRRILGGKRVVVPWARIRGDVGRFLGDFLFNRTVSEKHPLAGIMHLCIMWGMIVLFMGTIIVSIEYDLFQKILGLERGIWFGPFFLGFELVLDGFGVLLIAGLVIALLRRYALNRPQLKRRRTDWILPVWLLGIAGTGFFVEGLRLAGTSAQLTYAPEWSPVGYAVSYTHLTLPTKRIV